MDHKGISLWFIRESHWNSKNIFKLDFLNDKKQLRIFCWYLYLDKNSCSFDLWGFQSVSDTPNSILGPSIIFLTKFPWHLGYSYPPGDFFCAVDVIGWIWESVIPLVDLIVMQSGIRMRIWLRCSQWSCRWIWLRCNQGSQAEGGPAAPIREVYPRACRCELMLHWRGQAPLYL